MAESPDPPTPTTSPTAIGHGATVITAPAAPTSAVHRVFGIAELAENIFLYTPWNELLWKVPRVCKNWKSVVDGSVNLQRALFFEPVAGASAVWVESDAKYDQDTWKEYMDGSFFVSSEDKSEKIDVLMNPVFNEICEIAANLEHSEVEGRQGPLEEYIIKALHPDASWRRMLACQPPLHEIHLERYSLPEERSTGPSLDYRPTSKACKVACKHGVRAGALVHRKDGLLGSWFDNEPFEFRWAMRWED